jgi:hypothetical protein
MGDPPETGDHRTARIPEKKRNMMGKRIKKWLPQDGKRIEANSPAGKIGISERTGFKIVMMIAGALLAVAVILIVVH